MSDVTIASTTDSEEDVKLAAGLPAEGEEPKEEAISEEDKESSKAEGESEPPKPEGDKKPKSAAASEAANEEEEEEEEQPKAKGGFQKRIDKLTEEKYNLRDENRDLRERLERLEALAPKPEVKVEAKEDVKPARDKFKTDDEYYEALGRWGARQEVKTAEATATSRANQEQLEVIFGNYNAGVQDFRDENPDYDEVVGDTDLRIPIAVQNAIISYEREGPALAYFLAKNPEQAKKLEKMNDVRAVAELGRIHAKLFPEVADEVKTDEVKVTPPTKKPVVRAPAPIKAARASATQTAVPLDDLPYQDYRRVRDQQERGRIRR